MWDYMKCNCHDDSVVPHGQEVVVTWLCVIQFLWNLKCTVIIPLCGDWHANDSYTLHLPLGTISEPCFTVIAICTIVMISRTLIVAMYWITMWHFMKCHHHKDGVVFYGQEVVVTWLYIIRSIRNFKATVIMPSSEETDMPIATNIH